MKTRDVVYFLVVLVVTALFLGLASSAPVAHTASLQMSGVEGHLPGKVRDVDVAALREQIREGTLSDHEATFYREVEQPR